MMTKAEQTLSEVYRTYIECENFRCQAVLNRVIRTDTAIHTRFHMNLSFARPSELYLEWWTENSPFKHELTLASRGWVIRHSKTNLEWSVEPSIELAIAGQAGISGGVVLDIPMLLSAGGHNLFDDSCKVRLDIDDQNDLILLSGVKAGTIERTIKLRAKDRLVVASHDCFMMPGGRVESECEYTNIEMK